MWLAIFCALKLFYLRIIHVVQVYDHVVYIILWDAKQLGFFFCVSLEDC